MLQFSEFLCSSSSHSKQKPQRSRLNFALLVLNIFYLFIHHENKRSTSELEKNNSFSRLFGNLCPFPAFGPSSYTYIYPLALFSPFYTGPRVYLFTEIHILLARLQIWERTCSLFFSEIIWPCVTLHLRSPSIFLQTFNLIFL